jgi:hypothetical protein
LPDTPADQRGWLEAVTYASALRGNGRLPFVRSARVNLARGETARLSTVTTYLRGYRVGLQWGWSDKQVAAILGTTQRLVVHHRQHGWLSFWFTDLLASAPALESAPRTVDLAWQHKQAPLRFTGHTAPLIAVHVAAYSDPARWTRSPGLQPVLRAIPPVLPQTRSQQQRWHPGAVVVLNADTSDLHDGNADLLRAGTHGVLLRRERPFWRVRFDTGRTILVDPGLLTLLR